MKIEINHTCADFDSYRAERVKSLFNAETGYSWSHTAELPIDDKPWQIGLIVGPSGSGKSSLGRALNIREGAMVIKVLGEPGTAATWIWANGQLDGGDICESEIVKIDYNLSPKEFYAAHIIPALERTLKRCLIAIASGYIRRVPQVDEYASYDAKL